MDDFQISGLTDAQGSDLRRIFEIISNSDDWKAPIDAWIHSTDLALAQAACLFFTCTELAVTRHGTLDGEEAVRVQADGYRAGPAGA